MKKSTIFVGFLAPNALILLENDTNFVRKYKKIPKFLEIAVQIRKIVTKNLKFPLLPLNFDSFFTQMLIFPVISFKFPSKFRLFVSKLRIFLFSI